MGSQHRAKLHSIRAVESGGLSAEVFLSQPFRAQTIDSILQCPVSRVHCSSCCCRSRWLGIESEVESLSASPTADYHSMALPAPGRFIASADIASSPWWLRRTHASLQKKAPTFITRAQCAWSGSHERLVLKAVVAGAVQELRSRDLSLERLLELVEEAKEVRPLYIKMTHPEKG